jgi:hypothetical protein
MHQFWRHQTVFGVLGFLLTRSSLAVAFTPVQSVPSQSQTPGSSKARRNDSTGVVAKLSPEEIEEWELNDRYQSIAEQQKNGTCIGEVIKGYKSDVIPRAGNLRGSKA